MSDAHKASANLAMGSLMEIISRGQALQAAIIRGATQQELTVIRSEVHDVLDAYLDNTSSAALAVRAILEP